jgi:phosphoribosylglycinamide formyltransferase
VLDRYSGATIHFVDEKYDSGPILAQRVVPVRADDTPSDLAARVLKEVCVFFSFLSFNWIQCKFLSKLKFVCHQHIESCHQLIECCCPQEHKMYTEAVSALCEDRIFWREDGVPLIRKSWNEAEYLWWCLMELQGIPAYDFGYTNGGSTWSRLCNSPSCVV